MLAEECRRGVLEERHGHGEVRKQAVMFRSSYGWMEAEWQVGGRKEQKEVERHGGRPDGRQSSKQGSSVQHRRLRDGW